MAQCEHCKAHCIWRGSSNFPEHGCLVGYVPITNADRIRAMTDEELAAYLSKVQGDIFRGEMRLTAQWLDWLQEVNTDDN